MIKKYYNSFLEYSKNHFKENKKLILKNLLFYWGLIISLILIDQLTKTFLFQGEMEDGKLVVTNGAPQYDFYLFGIRSVSNPGVTFFGNFFPLWFLHLFSIFIFIICSFFAIYSHDKLLIIAISFTFAGTFGNFLDRAMFNGYVKDIIYIPWLQNLSLLNGTFNFADTWLFSGSMLAVIYLIIMTYKHYQHNKF